MVNYYRRREVQKGMGERVKGFSIVFWIIVFTVFVSGLFFILTVSQCEGTLECRVVDYFALKPSSILQGDFIWTLVLHIFVHGSLGHLLINMFVLFSLGSLGEKIIGRKRFFWFYIISGIFAGLLSVLLAGVFGNYEFGGRIFGSPEIFMVGASGAIFAIAGLYVILLPKLRFSIIFFPFFSLPAYIMIPLVLFLVWGLSVVFNWPIGNVAHFGGFLAGIIYGVYLRRKYRRKVILLQRMIR